MVLVDTSVWIDHFRAKNEELAGLLWEGLVLMHPSVAGELACGNLHNRLSILANLQALRPAKPAFDSEVLRFLEERRLWGRGLGWVDAHLVASALLTPCRFWTLDKRLNEVAVELGVV